jgi:hypothetical protein
LILGRSRKAPFDDQIGDELVDFLDAHFAPVTLLVV